MFRPKLIGGFFGRFLAVFVLLMIPWPGVGEAYGAFFRAGGNLLFSSFGTGGLVRFLPLEESDGVHDHVVHAENLQTGMAVGVRGRSRITGYQPTAYVIALIVATPLPWSRRLKALAWGLLLVNAYVAVRMLLLLLVTFSSDALGLFSPGAVMRTVLGFSEWVVVRSFGGSFVVPLGIWALAMFRRGDWSRIFGAR